MPIKLGIIGAGAIGQSHAQTAKRVGVDIACIADVNEQAARTLASASGVSAITSKPEELLARPDVNAVIIGVPNKFHKEIAVAALKAGKDVLLEKPMAMNITECDEINATARANNRIVQIGFVNRFAPVAQSARKPEPISCSPYAAREVTREAIKRQGSALIELSEAYHVACKNTAPNRDRGYGREDRGFVRFCVSDQIIGSARWRRVGDLRRAFRPVNLHDRFKG